VSTGRSHPPEDAVPGGLQQGGGEGLPGECKAFWNTTDLVLR